MIDNPDFSPVWNNLGKVEAISVLGYGNGDAQNAGMPISLWHRVVKIATFLSTKESIASDFSAVIINISKIALLDTNFGLRFLRIWVQVKSTFQIRDFISKFIFWLYGSSNTLTDTIVSGQLYLRPRSQNPVATPMQILYFNIPVGGRGHFQVLRVRF